jgi:hypothetical protein
LNKQPEDKGMETSEQKKKRGPGNPNFVAGHEIGNRLHPKLSKTEKTVLVSTKIPESLKAKLEALPGTNSEKVRRAIELLIKMEGLE